MKYICDSCEKYPCSADETKLMLSCPAYSPKSKPITNADRIRSMTDEELAEWITELTDCAVYPYTRKDAPCISIGQTCAESWLDWLRQEAMING